jgi:hypothetical protein
MGDGAALISKRLDRFLIAKDLLAGIGLYRTWVEYPYISDHALIVLQLELPPLYKSFPFKLNPYWLQFQDFDLLVQDMWTKPQYYDELDCQKRLLWKLKDLKERNKQWKKKRLDQSNTHLKELEYDITVLLTQVTTDILTKEKEIELKEKEGMRNNLLKEKEEIWHQRSRAIWIKSGD